MSAITVIGVDLAKNTFQLHGVDANGKVGLRRKLRRGQVANYFANLPNAWSVWKLAALPLTGLG